MCAYGYKLGFIRGATLVLTLALPAAAQATIVTMDTSLGNIEIQLYDQTAPKTVANFLSYVKSGAYDNSFIHRSVPGFIIQGGGYTWDTAGNSGYSTIPANAPVVNEYGAPNVAGTIAMAKLGSDPNSATSQWFFNLADNSSNLDNQNGGFTVFGQVLGNGMQVVDAIAALPTVNAGGAFTNLPLATPLVNGFTSANLVMIQNVVVDGVNSGTPVPVPAAAWLFAGGLAGLAGNARRKNPAARLPTALGL